MYYFYHFMMGITTFLQNFLNYETFCWHRFNNVSLSIQIKYRFRNQLLFECLKNCQTPKSYQIYDLQLLCNHNN